MRHQLASIHELARIELLAGLPGETLGRLAEHMIRWELAPGEVILESEDDRSRFWVVIAGMLRSTAGGVVRPGDSLGGDDPPAEALQAVTPAVVASCERETFERLVRPSTSL
jgi:CRP-like cAMP-binding protein